MIFAYAYRLKGIVPGPVCCAGCVVATNQQEAEKVTRNDNRNINGMDDSYFEYSIINPSSNGHHILLAVPDTKSEPN